jgi:hypothetical protein
MNEPTGGVAEKARVNIPPAVLAADAAGVSGAVVRSSNFVGFGGLVEGLFYRTEPNGRTRHTGTRRILARIRSILGTPRADASFSIAAKELRAYHRPRADRATEMRIQVERAPSLIFRAKARQLHRSELSFLGGASLYWASRFSPCRRLRSGKLASVVAAADRQVPTSVSIN